MPNHVANQLTFTGTKEDVKALLLKIGSFNNNPEPIVFEKISPMPRELRSVTSPVRIITEKQLKKELEEIKKRKKEDPKSFLGFTHGITQEMHNDYIKRFGCSDWYDWSCQNWGTKWSAYDQMRGKDVTLGDGRIQSTIFFSTAWSCPYPIIEKISRKFPTVEVELKYSDEDAGSNLGIVRLLNGVPTYSYEPTPCSNEAMRLYFELHPGCEEYYKLDENNQYVYKEE